MKSEYDIGYTNGFYAALKSFKFLTGLEGTTLRDVREGIDGTLQTMVDDGDMEYIRSGVDEFLEAAQVAEDQGLGDEFLAFLDDLEKQERERGNK